MWGKLLSWTLVAFLVFFVVKSPHAAAHTVTTVFSGIGQFISGLAA